MWRNTRMEDLQRIEIGASPDYDMRTLLPDTEGMREMINENGRTWEIDGRVIAIVGVMEQWKGVGVVWSLLSEESLSKGLRLTLGVRRFIDMLHKERGYWRLQATIEKGSEVARLWIIRLGFGYEGTMTAYGPDMKTHDMYARVVI